MNAHLLREARNAAPQRSLLLIFGAIAPLAFVETLVKGKQNFIDQCRSTCHTSCCGGLPASAAAITRNACYHAASAIAFPTAVILWAQSRRFGFR
jgi:hypothetical protein